MNACQHYKVELYSALIANKNHDHASFEGVCVNYRHPGPRRVWKGGSAAHPPPPFRRNHRNRRKCRKCRPNSRRVPGGHELLVKNTILGTKIRKMETKNVTFPCYVMICYVMLSYVMLCNAIPCLLARSWSAIWAL